MAASEHESDPVPAPRSAQETDTGIHTPRDGIGPAILTDGTHQQVEQADLKHEEAVNDEKNAEKVVSLASQDDTDESREQIIDMASRVQHTMLGEDLYEHEKHRGDLRRRSKQAILHLTFTEIRITELEKELRNLRAKIDDLPNDFKLSEKKSPFPVYDHVLKRSSYDEFELTSHSMDLPVHQRPSLEVLILDYIPHIRTNESSEKILQRSTRLSGLYDRHETIDGTPERLRIRSAPLIGHLELVCSETLSVAYVWNPTQSGKSASVVLLRPFKLLFGYEREIRTSVQEVEALSQAAERHKDGGGVRRGSYVNQEFEYEDLLKDLKLLIEFIDVDLKSTLDLRQAIRDGVATDIEYGDLWHLFQPGDMVLARSNRAQAFKVVNFTGGRNRLISRLKDDKATEHSVNGFVVDCLSICFDGTDYVPKLEKFAIRKFTHRRSITSLEVYPLRFDEKSEALSRDLVNQGHQYLDLTRESFSHRTLKGRTLDEPPQELDAQVIVDMTLAVNTEEDWRLTKRVTDDDLTVSDIRETIQSQYCGHGKETSEGCCGSDYVFKDLSMNRDRLSDFRRDQGTLFGPRSADELTEEDLILLPHWVYGFVLRSRQWVTLRMTDLSEVQFENDFDELMLSDSHKRTILALVENHENARTASPTNTRTVGAALDLVKGKGTGIVLLLHGEPGVGKTSTAECVADKTKRPLFPITCGDIGETAMEVERNLYHNFRLAHKWGCVLLLDEADVFLAKRNKTDLRRNAVTSVFLRSLEYYAGILFLTTNRVGGIDPAFKSRINWSLYYPRLGPDTSLKLHEVFIRRARAEQKKTGIALFTIKDKEILRFAKRHYRQLMKEGYNTWNGRQIKNAFQTAIALVEHEAAQNEPGCAKPILGKAQFEIVAQGSKEFDSYLMRTLQGADHEIAIRDQWRADLYDDGIAPASSTSKSTRKASRAGFPSARDSESNTTEDDTESEDEDDDEDEDADTMGAASKARASSVAGKNASKGHAGDKDDFEEYEEFRKFQAMRKAKGKKL